MKKGDRVLNASQLSRPKFAEVDLADQAGFLGKGMIL